MKVASPQPLQPLPPLPPSPAAPSAPPAPAAPRREPHPSPALQPCLAESAAPLTPGATLTDLAAQPIAHKPAVHLSASPIATVAGPAPGPVSGLIFNHKAPVQVPMDLEPIAYKPSPPIIGGEQLAPVSPVGACGAVSGSAPTASPIEIATMEMLLADPAAQEMAARFGGQLQPMRTDNDVSRSIVQRYGPDLAARLDQYARAQKEVDAQFLRAMTDQARSDALVPDPREQARLGFWRSPSGRLGDSGFEFNPVAFARFYAAGDSPERRAFAHLYGADPLRLVPGSDDGPFPQDTWMLGRRRLQTFNSDRPSTTPCVPTVFTAGREISVNPHAPARLNDSQAVWFDPMHGWTTEAGNLKGDWFDRFGAVLFSTAFTAITFGAGPLAAMTQAAANGSVGAAIGAGAAGAAIGNATMQLANNGRINFRQLLQSALAGGVTGGITALPGIRLPAESTFAQRLLSHTGRASLQGALQEVMGGRFRDGLTSGLVSGLAQEMTVYMDRHIATAQTTPPPYAISHAEANALRLLTRATASAMRAVASGNAAAGMASDFLGSFLGEVMQRGDAGHAAGARTSGGTQAAETQRRRPAQAAQPQQTRPAAQSVTVAAGDTLESLARQLYGSRWRAGLPVLMADNQITTNAWGSPLIRPGQSLQARPLDGLRASQIEQLSRLGGQVIGRNARGLNLREQIERIRAQAPATPMRPSKPALPEWARPQDWAPTVENARRLGLPQAARPEAQHGSPAPSTTQQPAEPSWGQSLNRNMRQWGEGVIDRLDEAAVADGGGLVTALAALARTPARSFTSFMQGTAGTVSLLDGRVRGEISDGLSQVMSDPGLIGRAASDYWRSRTLADMAADLYADGATGAMMGGAGAAALGRLNRLPGLGTDVNATFSRAIQNAYNIPPINRISSQRGGIPISSNNIDELDWSRISPRTGGDAGHHVRVNHGSMNLSKPTQGVFYGDPIDVVEEAWRNARRLGIKPINIRGRDYYIVPRSNAGYAGGMGGQLESLDFVTIITEAGTSRIVTGFPSGGTAPLPVGYEFFMKRHK